MSMLDSKQDKIMAGFIADFNGGEVDDWLGEADATRDEFDRYINNDWREAVGRHETVVCGFRAVYYDSVQARSGDQRVSVFAVDFGGIRGVFQI